MKWFIENYAYMEFIMEKEQYINQWKYVLHSIEPLELTSSNRFVCGHMPTYHTWYIWSIGDQQ